MADDKFRLPVSSYEEVAKIIKAYGYLNAPSVPSDLSKLTSQNPTMISANNAFLLAIGLVEGGKKKKISDKGYELARALEHEMPGEITDRWRDIVLSNEFLQKLVSAVRIRKGMELATLKSHVAYSAGLPKSKEVMTGAGTVVDILIASGLIKEEQGKLVAPPEVIEEEKKDIEGHEPGQDGLRTPGQICVTLPPVMSGGISGQISQPKQNTIYPTISVNIQIQIQCSAAEVDSLAPKLRSLLNHVTKPEEIKDKDIRESEQQNESSGTGSEAIGINKTGEAE